MKALQLGSGVMRALQLVAPRIELDQPDVALPTSIFGPSLAILLIVFIGFGGLGIWMFTAQLATGAVATGQIIVESNRKSIQHLEGGIIDQILVHDGEAVKAGQVLVSLDGQRDRISYTMVRDRSDQDRSLIARLSAERDQLPSVTFPDDLVERAKTEAALAGILHGEERQFETRRASLQGQVAVLQQRVGQYKEEIVGLQAQVESKTGQLGLINDELSGVQDLYNQGYAPKTRLLALERDAQDLTGARAQNQSAIAEAKVAIGETQMQIIQSGVTFREDVVEKLRETNGDLLDATQRLAAEQETIDRLDIKSPIDGQVVGLDVHTHGGVISPGEKLMDVVPTGDRLVVEAQIPPTDIDHVQVGLPAEVRLSALRQRTAPTLSGTVITLSKDVMIDPATHAAFYSARIEIPPEQLARLDADEKLVAGMPAQVLIKNGARTVFHYIVGPISDAIFRSFRQ